MSSDWYQQQLTPSEVYEINLRVGAIPSTDHVQWLVEVKDPLTGVLIAQAAGPHYSYTRLPEAVEDACAKVRALVDATLAPF